MEICFATHNQNKLREISDLVPHQIKLLSLNDVGVKEDIPETGSTIEENAGIKSTYIFRKTGMSCFADDTGLEVMSLGGEPGVYSARYAGNQRNEGDNMNLLLKKLENYSDRSAQFKTVIHFIDQNAHEHHFEGIAKGNITMNPRGDHGFGYDPIFQPEGSEKTFAEMTLKEKNKISHRAMAFEKLVSFLNFMVK